MFKIYIIFDTQSRKVRLKSSEHVEPNRMEILEEIESTISDRARIDKCKYWIRTISPYVDPEPLPYHFRNAEDTKHFYCSRPDRLPRRFRKFIRVT